MKKIAGIIFFVAWMLCGCSLETFFESPASGAVTLMALIVCIVCAIVLGSNDN